MGSKSDMVFGLRPCIIDQGISGLQESGYLAIQIRNP